MKKSFLAVAVMVAVLFISNTFAQKEPKKEDMLKEIATLSNTKKPEDSAKAYALGKDYLVRFGKDTDNNTAKVRTYVDAYRHNQFFIQLDAKKYADTWAIGKEILGEHPDDLDVLMNLALAGYTTSASPDGAAYTADAIAYSRKAAQLLEGGSVPKTFSPFVDKNDATAYMYFIDGSLSMAKEPASAAGNIYKATQIESQVKNDALGYYLIAMYYEDVYAKLSAATPRDQTRINAAIDLMLDAYARACKRAEAAKHPNYTVWKTRFDQVYKFRKGTMDGIADFVTAKNAAPMPDPSKF